MCYKRPFLSKHKLRTYINFKYPTPDINDYNSTKLFVKSLPQSVISEVLADPDFGKPTTLELLIKKYKIALFKYHSSTF